MKKDDVIEFIREALGEQFPNISIGTWSDVDGQNISGSLNSSFFSGTKFYAPTLNSRYLHFTKIKSAIDILKSGVIWFSNLNKFNDKLEFLHGTANLFPDLNIDQLSALKNRIFALCLTEIQNEICFHNFEYHWMNYANDRNGLAFEFEFDPVLPPFYYLMKMQYYDNLIDDEIFHNLQRRIRSNLKNQDYYLLIEYLLPFLSAYKRRCVGNDNFISEKEVRLFYSDGNDSFNWNSNVKGEGTYCFEPYSESLEPFRQVPIAPINPYATFLSLRKIYIGRNVSSGDERILKELLLKSEIAIEKEIAC